MGTNLLDALTLVVVFFTLFMHRSLLSLLSVPLDPYLCV